MVFQLVLQDVHFSLKKLALAFLSDCVYWFLTSLKSCISRGLFDANAERHSTVQLSTVQYSWDGVSLQYAVVAMLVK